MWEDGKKNVWLAVAGLISWLSYLILSTTTPYEVLTMGKKQNIKEKRKEQSL